MRYGYRRVHVLLRREGWMINMKKTRRIYNELGLQLRNKHPKRRVKAKLREDRQIAIGPFDVWGEPCRAIGLSDNGKRISCMISWRQIANCAS